MSILTDVFVADSMQAGSYEGSSGDSFERVQLKGLTDIEFGSLWALINGEEWDFEKHKFENLHQHEESWLFRFPPPFVTSLAEISEPKARSAAADWAASEELQWPVADAHLVIAELVRLARASQAQSKQLFFWGCL